MQAAICTDYVSVARSKNDKGGSFYGVGTVTTLDGKKVSENKLPAGDWNANKQKWQEQGFKSMWSYANQFNIGGDCIYFVSNDHLCALVNDVFVSDVLMPMVTNHHGHHFFKNFQVLQSRIVAAA